MEETNTTPSEAVKAALISAAATLTVAMMRVRTTVSPVNPIGVEREPDERLFPDHWTSNFVIVLECLSHDLVTEGGSFGRDLLTDGASVTIFPPEAGA